VGDYPDRADWDAALAQVLDEVSPALVVSAGFMRILGAEVLARYAGCIINSHPSLLPLFPGAHAVRDALAAGVTETGTTVHLVDAGMDTGEVLAQVTEPIAPGDTEESLHERIKAHERHLIVAVLRQRLGLSRKTQH
jgi:phosphoribosylglycinamide formyltransferase-1